jgi:hypothetical protein
LFFLGWDCVAISSNLIILEGMLVLLPATSMPPQYLHSYQKSDDAVKWWTGAWWLPLLAAKEEMGLAMDLAGSAAVAARVA